VADPDSVAAPELRGRLTVRDRAVASIATAAALGADGVHRHGSGLSRVAGRELPRVDTFVAGDRVRVDVEIAVQWGRALADTAAAVRRDITAALATQSGLAVDGVTVHVAAVVAPSTHRELT
jgi:uncharacterized alkaline shock family protein YloU